MAWTPEKEGRAERLLLVVVVTFPPLLRDSQDARGACRVMDALVNAVWKSPARGREGPHHSLLCQFDVRGCFLRVAALRRAESALHSDTQEPSSLLRRAIVPPAVVAAFVRQLLRALSSRIVARAAEAAKGGGKGGKEGLLGDGDGKPTWCPRRRRRPRRRREGPNNDEPPAARASPTSAGAGGGELAAKAVPPTSRGRSTSAVVEAESQPRDDLFLWGSDANLTAMVAGITAWLSTSTRTTFSAAALLAGVRGGEMPFLRPGFVAGSEHRGVRIQRVLCAFLVQLCSDIVAPLVRSCFHVTVDGRCRSALVYLPIVCWRRLRSLELAKVTLRSMDKAAAVACCDGGGGADDAGGMVEEGEEKDEVGNGAAMTAPRAMQLMRLSGRSTRARGATPQGAIGSGRAVLIRRGHPDFVQRPHSGLGETLYASLRFLPDSEGRKLRPIATVRVGSVEALSLLARGASRRSVLPRSNAPACNSSIGLPCPSKSCLRDALDVLVCGRRLRALRLGLAMPDNRVDTLSLMCRLQRSRSCTPMPPLPPPSASFGLTTGHFTRDQTEYLRLCAFVRQVKAANRQQTTSTGYGGCGCGDENGERQRYGVADGTTRSETVFAVKADATRCFDVLPQASVAALVDDLITSAHYYRCTFEAVTPRPGPVSGSDAATSHNTPPPRSWSAVLSEDEMLQRLPPEPLRAAGSAMPPPHSPLISQRPPPDGLLGFIPRGWIVRERTATARRIDGRAVKRLILNHVERHLVTVPGIGVFEQRLGITQGSTVAALLCDTLLEAVDREIGLVLEPYCVHHHSLLLRRMDDLLLLTTSASAASAVVSRLQTGFPDVGYYCNPAKLVNTADDGCSADTSAERPGGSRRSCQRSAGAAAIGWCGLLLRFPAVDMEPCGEEKDRGGGADPLSRSSSSLLSTPRQIVAVSVDWRRFIKLPLCHFTSTPGSEHGFMLGVTRVLASLRMRCSVAVWSPELNSQPGRLQTYLQLGIVLADRVVALLQLAAPRPHLRFLFRPLKLILGATAAWLRHAYDFFSLCGSIVNTDGGDQASPAVCNCLRRRRTNPETTAAAHSPPFEMDSFSGRRSGPTVDDGSGRWASAASSCVQCQAQLLQASILFAFARRFTSLFTQLPWKGSDGLRFRAKVCAVLNRLASCALQSALTWLPGQQAPPTNSTASTTAAATAGIATTATAASVTSWDDRRNACFVSSFQAALREIERAQLAAP